MKTTAISFLLLVLPAFLFADDKKDPELVKVYCFSGDTEAGFKDKTASYFCKRLGDRGRKKKSTLTVETRDTADVVVQFLGREFVSRPGDTTYLSGNYAWTPEQLEDGVRVTLAVGDFVKGFHTQGINDTPVVGAAYAIERWIRENRDTILDKAKAQQ